MNNLYDSTNRQTGRTILWNHLMDQIRHPWSHQSPLLYQYCKHLVSGTISSQKVGADWYHFTILNWLWMIYMQMLTDKQPETYWEITWKTKFGTPYHIRDPTIPRLKTVFLVTSSPPSPFPWLSNSDIQGVLTIRRWSKIVLKVKYTFIEWKWKIMKLMKRNTS